MEALTPPADETRALRRCIRDVVALSVLSAAWERATPQGIAEDLTGVIQGMIDVDLVHVRLTGTGGKADREAARSGGGLEPDPRAREIGRSFEPYLRAGGSVPGATVAGDGGPGAARVSLTPVGFAGECGSLFASSGRPDFPTQQDRLILGMGANQAAMVLQRRRAEDVLRESEAQYRLLAENSTDLISRHDPEGRYLYASPASLHLLGYPPEELLGRRAYEFIHPDDHARYREAHEGRPGASGPERVTLRLRHKGGDWGWFETSSRAVLDPDGSVREYQCAARDVGERVRAEEEVRHLNTRLTEQATTDELTGLKNRRHFREGFTPALAFSTRTGQPLSLVLIDVDHFKRYNDTHGHPAGDAVLRAVGDILVEKIRPYDMAVRYGGEEFLLLLPASSATDARRVAERVRTAFADRRWPLRPVTASFGIATIPSDGLDPSNLIDAADKALYESKGRGRDCVTHYADLSATPPTVVALAP